MDAFEIIRVLKARQSAILEKLPAELRNEYAEIESFLRLADKLVVENGASVKLPIPDRFLGLFRGDHRPAEEPPRTAPLFLPSRVPLGQRFAALREFLRNHGPASRGQILANTRIPPGTLSALLMRRDFVRTGDGMWRLRGQSPRPEREATK